MNTSAYNYKTLQENKMLHISPGRPVRLVVFLLLPMLSPLVRIEMPLKLLALVTGGRILRHEPSESVLLQGLGSRDFSSLSVLLCRLLEPLFRKSLLPLQEKTDTLDIGYFFRLKADFKCTNENYNTVQRN